MNTVEMPIHVHLWIKTQLEENMKAFSLIKNTEQWCTLTKISITVANMAKLFWLSFFIC